jgi:glycosyltransferase involved in cell wall biosynthesis
VPTGRVDVVPVAGQDTDASPHAAPVPRLPRHLLAVGNRMPHKNFPLLLEALALIPAASRPHLSVTGSHGDDPLTSLVASLGLEAWVSLRGWLSADELDGLYAESSLIVFPTLFEGFGLPVLEAMSRGCPVVCSDIPVLHEVAGDAAVYVAPQDAAGLAATISRLLDDPAELARLSGLGRERARTFSWARTARQTVASFQRALAER